MSNNDQAECAICYSLQPCIGLSDSGDLICADRRACQQRNADNMESVAPYSKGFEWGGDHWRARYAPVILDEASVGQRLEYLIERDRDSFCDILEGTNKALWDKLANAYLMHRGVESHSRAALIPGVLFVWAGYVKERNANA